MEERSASFILDLTSFLNSHDAACCEWSGSASFGVIKLDEEVRAWCDPETGLPQVLLMTEVDGGLLLLLRDSSHRGSALLQRPGSHGFCTVRGPSDPEMAPLLAAWSAPNSALVRVGERVRLLFGNGRATDVVSLPRATGSVDASWAIGNGLILIALVYFTADPICDASNRGSIPPFDWPPSACALELRKFTASGWTKICVLPFATCGIALSVHGQRAGWCVSKDERGETAGELFVVELLPNAQPTPLTEGAGNCGKFLFAPDESGVVYLANHMAVGASNGKLAEPRASPSQSLGIQSTCLTMLFRCE